MSTAPAAFKAVTAGEPWGTGTEPFPENVPPGEQYVDAFGNRAVIEADGTVLVEGLGVGVNHGKPDGQWWPYSAELAAGPTNAEAWVGDATAGSDPVEEGPKAAPTATGVSGTPTPAVIAPAAPSPTAVVVATNSPAAIVAANPAPTVSVHQHPHTGGFIVTVEHLGGEVEHFVFRTFEEVKAKVESVYRAHFRSNPTKS